MREIGLAATELGPEGFLPAEPEAMATCCPDATLGRRTASGCASQRHRWTTRSRPLHDESGPLLVTTRPPSGTVSRSGPSNALSPQPSMPSKREALVVVRGRGQAREASPGLRGWQQATGRDPFGARAAHEHGQRLRSERTIRPTADFVSDGDHRVEVVYGAAYHRAVRRAHTVMLGMWTKLRMNDCEFLRPCPTKIVGRL